MNIIDSHIHICRCINGFGNSGEMQAIGGGYAVIIKVKHQKPTCSITK